MNAHRPVMSIIFIVSACALPAVLVLGWMLKGPARSRIRIHITDGRVVDVNAGRSLFDSLAREGIDLPSTCGGKGSCARCRCRVLKGGGAITGQERPFFSRAEVDARWRLACQVRVQRDITVEIPG